MCVNCLCVTHGSTQTKDITTKKKDTITSTHMDNIIELWTKVYVCVLVYGRESANWKICMCLCERELKWCGGEERKGEENRVKAKDDEKEMETERCGPMSMTLLLSMFLPVPMFIRVPF